MSDIEDLISDNNTNMSDSADVNLGGVTMWDLQDVKPDHAGVNMRDITDMQPHVIVTIRDITDVKPDASVTMRDIRDVKPDVIVTLRDIKDVKPDVLVTARDITDVELDANVTMRDLGDVKPDVNMTTAVKPYSFMTTSALEDVKPVVKRENSDSLEDEKACIEALRAAVLLQEENIRQRGSVLSVTAPNTDVDKNIRSLETDCYKVEDQSSLISGTASSKAEERMAYPSPSHALDCTDIKEEKTEICEPKRHPEGQEISERHGEETHKATLKAEEQLFKAKYSRSQTPHVVPEHCEPDRVSDVEQVQQSEVTRGQFGCLWCPNVYFLLTDRQRHMKQVHSDEYLKASLENGWQHVSSSHQQSGPSVAFLENSDTSGIEISVNKADIQPSKSTLKLWLNRENNKIDGQPIDTKQNCLSNCASLVNEQSLCLAKNSIDEGKGTYSSEIWSTDMCGKVFDHSSNLLSHIRVHTGEKPDVHGKSNGHTSTHADVRPYECGVFGNAFGHNSNIFPPVTNHTGAKQRRCDVGLRGKDFAGNSAFVTHKRTRTDGNPFKCDVCGKEFAHRCSLVTHKRIHTGEKPYKCELCGNCFTQIGNLLRHKRTHTGEKPYKCDICGKSFSRSNDLVDHKTTHTGEKPYKCDVCGKDFRQRSHFASHRRTHPGEKPYRCRVW